MYQWYTHCRERERNFRMRSTYYTLQIVHCTSDRSNGISKEMLPFHSHSFNYTTCTMYRLQSRSLSLSLSLTCSTFPECVYVKHSFRSAFHFLHLIHNYRSTAAVEHKARCTYYTFPSDLVYTRTCNSFSLSLFSTVVFIRFPFISFSSFQFKLQMSNLKLNQHENNHSIQQSQILFYVT